MKLHIDTEGKAVLENGMPVYLHEDGKAIPFDALAALNKITALNTEIKSHREAKEALEAKLSQFAGIDDPAKARFKTPAHGSNTWCTGIIKNIATVPLNLSHLHKDMQALIKPY
nr:hypothetical protein [Candidatus Regiella insecticola]